MELNAGRCTRATRGRTVPTMRRGALGLLVLVNGVVLLGQVWPAGAPPFARWVNIAFLTATLVLFLAQLARRR